MYDIYQILALLLILIIIKLAFILRYMPATMIQIKGGMVGYYNFISVGAEHENLAKKKRGMTIQISPVPNRRHSKMCRDF